MHSGHWLLCVVVLWTSIFLGEHLPQLRALRWPMLFVVACVFTVLFARRAIFFLAVCVLGMTGLSSGAHAWHGHNHGVQGECRGITILRSDPELFTAGTSVVVELNGVRYRASAFGMPGRRLAQRLSGESVYVGGQCGLLTGDFSRRDRVKHIVGKMSITEVSEQFGEGSAFIRAANRIRGVIAEGVASMSPENRALFLGLVIGDDRAQPQDMVQRFRDSGLSHLCAVSGQNVAFLLILIRPLTARRHRVVAWAISIVVIAWFVVVTRGEPSIIRASVMAGLVATSALVGKALDTRIVLSCTVLGLLLIDPMLAWSVGFALSVAATAGLAWFAGVCHRILRSGNTIASTVAAQLGTTPISLCVFGTAPIMSLVANPFAIPVAGVVMTIGLPLSILAVVFPTFSEIVGAVLTVPVEWVDSVATVSAYLSPPGAVNAILWCCLGLFIMWRRRSISPASGRHGL